MPKLPKIKRPKKVGPTNPPSTKKSKYTTTFHKSKAAAEKDKGKPNTPGEKMREFKGKMTMGQIRNKKTFAGETGLEGLTKKLNYQRRGKKLGGPAGSQLGDLNKDGKMSGYEKKRQTAIEKAMQKRGGKKVGTQGRMTRRRSGREGLR